jgi:cytidylate kinase
MTVITVSRQLGSNGHEIAVGVAQTLGLRLVDAATINQAAERAGVPQVALAELQHEGERGVANQVLKALQTMPNTVSFSVPSAGGIGGSRADSMTTLPFTGLFSPLVRPISASLDGYVRMVGLVIRGLAQEGGVLIAGRGGQILLKDHPQTLHVQVVAPLAYRINTMMERQGGDKRAVQNQLRASDRARFDYLRRYHNADWLDSTLYHMVLNAGKVPTSMAIELIIGAQKSVTG